MQTKALFDAYFWNDSSRICTSEPYWSGSMSAGTPGGYDFSQILSIGCLSPVSLSSVLAARPKKRTVVLCC
jgi:hypothetical protein